MLWRMKGNKGHLTVIGSLNVDYLASVERLPRPGETRTASALEVRFGGKGANQAVAAARQGAKVRLIGCVGQDAEGRAYLPRLRREGIDVRWVRRVRGKPTGRAFIALDGQGENFIVVASGANHALRPSHLCAAQFRGAALLLVQMEVPVATVVAAIGKRGAIPVLLNAAPLCHDFPWGQLSLDYLVVNEHEAAELFGGAPGASVVGWAAAVRSRLRRLRVNRLIVTRGKRATYYVTADQACAVPTVRVRPVDTVGAGDAFTGALAAHLALGRSMSEALILANSAGALATQSIGAQESMPTLRATFKLTRDGQENRGREGRNIIEDHVLVPSSCP